MQLRSENTIVCCNGYKMGWQLIISEPFREMNVNPSSEQINNCIDAICLLYSCPMPHELEFTTIVRNSFQCKQAHLAAALLPFLNDLEKKFVLEVIKLFLSICSIYKVIIIWCQLFFRQLINNTKLRNSKKTYIIYPLKEYLRLHV